MVKIYNDTQCKLCGHNFSHKYNLKRHLDENLCKKMKDLSLYEIYLRFSNLKDKKNQETQTEITKYKTISTQKNIDDINININNELYPIEKIKYDHIKFDDINCFIEKYKYYNRNIYLSKIWELILCDKKYTENQVVKYTKLHPPNFVFLYNKLQNFNKQLDKEIPVEEQSKYLNIGNIDLVSEYFYKFLTKVIIKIKDDTVKQSKKNGTWNEWNDVNEDCFKIFEKEIKNEQIIKDSIKYFLKNVIINDRSLRYKV
jgi:hypothetical protein